MKVWELERAVWEIDGIRIVIRAPIDMIVEAAEYKKTAADSSWTLKELAEKRINKCVQPYTFEFIDGSGRIPHKVSRLPKVRGSYSK
ncbi:MAG: hypothetical protein LBL59_00695 [Xanthomonadaceae bacterium]|jgi:hypothetical protein|nr:hypothetical protein [Xanthomonadaceae bacterium]